MEIARTIIEQLGGNKFLAMTGAKQMMSTGNGLQFKLPARFAAKGINCVQIELTESDTYDVRFLKVAKFDFSTVAESTGIYADQLRATFTSHTGLDTAL